MGETVTITIPWVPDQRANPNNHRVSERTRIRHRKRGALDAAYPIRAAFARHSRAADTVLFLFSRPVVLDITVRWPAGRNAWDDDNLVTAYKYVRDQLQREGIVRDDKLVTIGIITQERATEQPETVLVVRGTA